MEHLASYYDSTNSLSESIFNYGERQSFISDAAKHQFLDALSQSLDIEVIGHCILNEAKQLLPLSGVQISSTAGTFSFGKSEDLNIKKLSIAHRVSIDIDVSYAFRRALSPNELKVLDELHRCVKNPLGNAFSFLLMQHQAQKDALTGLGNRLLFDDSLNKFCSQMQRSNEKLSLIVFDLDNFKPVNDTFGHTQGDKVLVCVAEAINKALRQSDHAFRFGGDEFCCIALNSDEASTQNIVNRINQQLKADRLIQKHNITASFGIATLEGDESSESLFERADSALYDAKNAGRNRTVIAA